MESLENLPPQEAQVPHKVLVVQVVSVVQVDLVDPAVLEDQQLQPLEHLRVQAEFLSDLLELRLKVISIFLLRSTEVH